MPAPPRVIGLLALLAAGAAAEDDLARGLALFERLDYDRAVVVLGRALSGGLSGPDRLRAHETLAYAYVVLDDRAHAEEAFHAVLDLDPSFAVPKSRSPRLRDAFEAARASWEAGRRVQLAVDDEGERVLVTLSGDPRRVAKVELTAPSRTALLCDGRRCRGDRPEVPFAIEALDHRGEVLARAGPFEPAPRAPRWWLWIAAGVAVTGAALAIGLASADRDPPEGALGTLRLP